MNESKTRGWIRDSFVGTIHSNRPETQNEKRNWISELAQKSEDAESYSKT